MAFWVDDQGQLREGDEEQAQRYGFRPATDEDLAAHNERLDTEAADTKGPLGLIAEGAERGIGQMYDAPTRAFNALTGGPEWDPQTGAPKDQGLVDETPVTRGRDLFPEANSEEARLRTKAHPVLEGFGTGLAVAPVAAGVAAATGGLGLGALGPGIAAATAGTVVEAAAQEWDDAWLEKRPMELKNVAGYTAMFSLGNLLFHGAGKAVKKVLGGFGGEEAATSAGGVLGGGPSGTLGGRNIVAEATAKAERAAGGGGGAAQSVGAASAKEMQEPFDAALGSMTDRDAVVLARDADDHLHLAARHSADDLTRLAKGLSESLGTQLKYRDVRIATDALTPKQIGAQATWAREAVDKALGVAEQIRAGGPSGLDYGNAGKEVATDIERYARLLMDEPDPAKRFQLFDEFKKTGDKRIMQIAANFRSDATARRGLLKHLEEVFGSDEVRGYLRDGLENTKYWGHAATLQKELNAPWHELLKHYGIVQKALLEHVETKFGVEGAGRRVMASDPDLWLSVWNKDPRSAAKIGKALGGMFDGYQGLIEAREAHGFVDKEGLPALAQSIRNMMEDWNLATTVGVARNKVAHASRNPRSLERLMALVEKTPMVGSTIGAARHVASLAGDLRIQKGTPLFEVWDRGLKRYALHPELADASINANYSPWMQETLRARGAPIPGPQGPGAGGLFGKASPGAPQAPAAPAAAASGGIGQAAAAAAKEHGHKVAGAGLLGASAALEDKDNPNGAAGAGVGGLALLLGKGGGRLFKEEASELIGVLARQEGKDDWTHGLVRRWLKSDAPLTVSAIEHENTKPILVDGWRWEKPEPAPMPKLRAFVADAVQRTGASEDEVLRTVVSEGTGFKPRAAAPELVDLPDPGPEPQQGPVGVYRDAMRTVNQGGEALIRQKATAALRFTPRKGRSPMRAFAGRRDLDAAVDAARDSLQELSADPSALVDRLAGTTGELGVTHPSVYMALVEKAHAIVGYLSAEAPQRVGRTLLDPEGMPPSADRSLDFAYKVVGAAMPVQAMSDISRLDVPPEELAAFQQHWPELWEPLRAELLGQVQRRHEAGRPVDSEKLRQLDALLQMDGQLDPSGSSAVAQQILTAAEQAPAGGAQGAPSGGGKPSGAAASSFRTRLAGAQMENQIS